MPDTPNSLTDLFGSIERLLFSNEPVATLNVCYFTVHCGQDSGRLVLRILPTLESARDLIALDGNRFIAPKARLSGHFKRASEGTITEQAWNPPARSADLLDGIAAECRRRQLRLARLQEPSRRGQDDVGRFLADLNMPSVEDAERVARRLADVLRAG